VGWFEVAVLFLLGVLAIAGALAMVLQRDPIRAALGLLLTMITLGIMYLLLSAPFVGFVQLVVYAGAIVVLFLLALMNFPTAPLLPDHLASMRPWMIGTIIVLGLGLQQMLIRFSYSRQIHVVDGTPEGIGSILLGKYIYVFQLAGLLLLVALVAAIYLTREDEPAPSFEVDPEELEDGTHARA